MTIFNLPMKLAAVMAAVLSTIGTASAQTPIGQALVHSPHVMWKKTFTLAALLLVLTSVATSVYATGSAYEGQINGEFHGWDGETMYKLMDGHIIQQSEYHYHYHYAYGPHVIIYKSNAGGYKIHVEDDNDQDIGIVVLK
jgi:hypothetical protein